jgi:hypothetical protein
VPLEGKPEKLYPQVWFARSAVLVTRSSLSNNANVSKGAHSSKHGLAHPMISLRARMFAGITLPMLGECTVASLSVELLQSIISGKPSIKS